MRDLDATRKSIDGIDRKILELLNQRAEKVRDIAGVKNNRQLPPFDPSRERKIIDELVKNNKGPLKAGDIEAVMDVIFKVYRSMFLPIRIAYLGPEGTFTQQAALKQFGEKGSYLPCKTINNVFREVEQGRADYGVIPIENSIEGVVTHTLDMFVDSSLKITSEILLAVHHYLLSMEQALKDIKKIFSHPQAISQCGKWIMENLSHAEIIESDSTAKAVKRAAGKKNSAAIGSRAAASIYGVKVLAEQIEDYEENITRFLVVGKEYSKKTGSDRTSILLSIKDRVGALQDILKHFSDKKVNLTRIESRPSKRKAWDYLFFFDFIGHKDDNEIRDVLAGLEKESVFLKVLGSYPIGEKNENQS